jgi:hypothetical protein
MPLSRTTSSRLNPRSWCASTKALARTSSLVNEASRRRHGGLWRAQVGEIRWCDLRIL